MYITRNHANAVQVNGIDDEGSKVQEAAGVTWWPTFVVYNDGQEKWRAKVPNPPDQHPISGLATALATVKAEN
jgi:thioredoxin 1